MGLVVEDELMSCEASRHTAEKVGINAWRLSWLPGRVFDRNSAISALMAAEELAGWSPRQALVTTLLTDELGLERDEWPRG